MFDQHHSIKSLSSTVMAETSHNELYEAFGVEKYDSTNFQL